MWGITGTKWDKNIGDIFSMNSVPIVCGKKRVVRIPFCLILHIKDHTLCAWSCQTRMRAFLFLAVYSFPFMRYLCPAYIPSCLANTDFYAPCLLLVKITLVTWGNSSSEIFTPFALRYCRLISQNNDSFITSIVVSSPFSIKNL